jgi:hypothetical protein
MIRTPLHLAVVLLFSLASVSFAAEPFGVKLLRPDSLEGWTYGDQAPAGWTIAGGRLSGNRQATPLLSGFSFGDFELRLDWSVAAGGTLRILLPEVPCGQGLEVLLGDGDGCGQVLDTGRTCTPGQKVEPVQGKMHTAALCRAGAKLTVKVDNRPVAEIGLATGRRFGLGLAVTNGEASLAELRVQEPAGEAMFNGKNFDGWWTPGKMDAWRMEKDVVVLTKECGDYLRSEKEYGNFTLSFEYKMGKAGNSGAGIRTPRKGWPSGDGMELQLWHTPHDTKLDKHQTMAIYGNVPPIARADKPDQWNRVVVKADGWMVSAWMNGELVQQYNTLNHPELKHRHLVGWIGLQDHQARIEYRNVRVLEAPPGTSLAAWLKPLPPRADTATLDRLLNPERLSLADGVRSGVVTKSVSGDKPAEHVLAELTGPGAVVRIVRKNNEGRLAFYFDGEAKPRLECKPEELLHLTPELTEDPEPLLTFLGFAKSLKIVLRDAKTADYRVDYMTFPAGLPVATFTGPDADIPRGWLSAIAYRHLHCDWGVHREHDPLPRFESVKRTIAPGQREPLVHIDGAGIVQWLKLRANKQVLTNNDLWLEVTVDGECSPAVAAPARFLYPGLAGQGRFHNFLLVDRGGATNRLAMPFGNGITIAARNAGNKPIRDVGLTVSVEPATEQTRQDICRRMRLRGIFQPAYPCATDLACQVGCGRLVALVYQQPDGQPTGIDALVVDGKPQAGWTVPNFDLLLGRCGDFRSCLSGRHKGLGWYYAMLSPVEFQQSLVLRAFPGKVGDRLALFYVKK